MIKKPYWLLSFVLVVLLLTGCGTTGTTQGKFSTPRKTWAEFVSAMDASDAQAFFGLLSASAVERAGGNAGSASSIMNTWRSSLFAPDTYNKARIASIDEHGGQAEIKFTFPGHEEYSGKLVLVKEGGGWKLASSGASKKLSE